MIPVFSRSARCSQRGTRPRANLDRAIPPTGEWTLTNVALPVLILALLWVVGGQVAFAGLLTGSLTLLLLILFLALIAGWLGLARRGLNGAAVRLAWRLISGTGFVTHNVEAGGGLVARTVIARAKPADLYRFRRIEWFSAPYPRDAWPTYAKVKAGCLPKGDGDHLIAFI